MLRMYVESYGPHSRAPDSEYITARFPIVSEDLPTFIHWVAQSNQYSPFETTPLWDTLEEIDDPELEQLT